MKKRFMNFFLLGLLTLSSCTFYDSSSQNTSILESSDTSLSEVVNDEIYAIYVKAVDAGYTGTYEEWLDTVKGADGKDGSNIFTGKGAPKTEMGKAGDIFIDVDTWDFYVKNDTGWNLLGNIKGPKGDDTNSWQTIYDDYIQRHPDYTGTLDEFIKDVVDGNLNNTIKHKVEFNTKNGSAIEDQIVAHGEKIKKPANPVKVGSSFLNWTYQGEEWSFIGYTCTEDMILESHYDRYKLDIDYNSALGTVTGAGYHRVGSAVSLKATPIKYALFTGWQNENGDLLSTSQEYCYIIPDNDSKLTALFEPYVPSYTLSATCEYGNVEGTGVFKVGQEVTLKANLEEYFDFYGWYEGKTLISKENPYTFKMLDRDVTYKAEVSQKRDLSSIYFGTYPQTRVDDSELIDKLNLEADKKQWINYDFYKDTYSGETDVMYYKDVVLDDIKYRCVKIKNYRYTRVGGGMDLTKTIQDDNGYLAGNTYWFKFERVRWDLINDYSFYISSMILDSSPLFNKNSYGGSHDQIRTYGGSTVNDLLNFKMYHRYLTDRDRARLYTISTIEDPPVGPGDLKYTYHIFSIDSYDFNIMKDRCGDKTVFANGTDYANCMGLGYYPENNKTEYWTRIYKNVGNIGWEGFVIDKDGVFARVHDVLYTYYGVRPCIHLHFFLDKK